MYVLVTYIPMTKKICVPNRIEDVTVEDLQQHRWCYYHNDDEGYDSFEHVIPDTHPDFSQHVVEMELAEFTFKHGETAYGSYDGSESFRVFLGNRWFSFWFGVAKPDLASVTSLKEFLAAQGYELPVEARAKWSGSVRILNGFQYINELGEVSEVTI